MSSYTMKGHHSSFKRFTEKKLVVLLLTLLLIRLLPLVLITLLQHLLLVLLLFNPIFDRMMAFTNYVSVTFIFFLLLISFQFHARAQLPVCKDSFPFSLLPNSSFEKYSGCNNSYDGFYEGGLIGFYAGVGGVTVNNWNAFRQGFPVNYFNLNYGTNKQGSIFDTTADRPINCGFPKVPLPLPDSTGFIAVSEGDASQFQPEDKTGKSYITTCLSKPLYAGQFYLLNFYFGFGTQVNKNFGCANSLINLKVPMVSLFLEGKIARTILHMTLL